MSKTGKKITLAEGLKEAVGVVKDKKKLNEGTGASYDITSTCTIEKVTSFSLDKIDNIRENKGYGLIYVDATFNCDIDLAVGNLEFASYDFGGDLNRSVDGKATKIKLVLNFEEDSDKNAEEIAKEEIEKNKDEIIGILTKDTFETDHNYGGGWSHSTYDGTIATFSEYGDDISYKYYTNDFDLEILDVEAKITEKEVIDYIDKVVTGDAIEIQYSVYDEDWEHIESFDNQEDAIEFAKSNNGYFVTEVTLKTDIDGNTSIFDDETVWEYSEEDEDDMDESLTLKEARAIDSIVARKAAALANYLGISKEGLRHKNIGGNDYFVTEDGDEFTVFDDDEADKEFRAGVESIIDDLGIESFSPDFQQTIIDRGYVNTDWFQEALEESNRFYVDAIESETYNTTYANRLIDELEENGIISEDDITEDGELKDGLDIDELKEQYAQLLNDNTGDPVEWYRDNFGNDTLKDVVRKYNLLDVDAIADEVKELDGRGPNLSLWDGQEIELDDGYFAYKQDDHSNNFDVFNEIDYSVIESLNEDTVKTKDGKWANVGKDGKVDSGKFKTKNEADAQRRAMFANKG